jgi:hypothetical protein
MAGRVPAGSGQGRPGKCPRSGPSSSAPSVWARPSSSSASSSSTSGRRRPGGPSRLQPISAVSDITCPSASHPRGGSTSGHVTYTAGRTVPLAWAHHMAAAGARVVEVDHSHYQDRHRQGKSDPLVADCCRWIVVRRHVMTVARRLRQTKACSKLREADPGAGTSPVTGRRRRLSKLGRYGTERGNARGPRRRLRASAFGEPLGGGSAGVGGAAQEAG